jgi:hypothetical protein
MKKLLEKIKTWWNLTAKPWLTKNWLQLINIVILFIAENNTETLPLLQAVLGLWLFVIIVYYVFWGFFGVKNFFKKEK